MELAGVKKCLNSIEKSMQVDSVTIDKHPQVCAYLRQNDYDYFFDLWHLLKNSKKQIRSAMKKLKDEEERNQLKELRKRFVVHVYTAVEKSNGNPELCKEYIFSFFLHVQGIHEWNAEKFTALIHMNENTEIGPNFKKESFQLMLECAHEPDYESKHLPIDPKSTVYQLLLEIATKTQFMNDLCRLKHGNFTSFVESFHSVCIRYRPKRKFYPIKGFELRTMLAALAFNENRLAEIRGERTVQRYFEYYSKANGEKRIKCQKGPVAEQWKAQIVEETIKFKREHEHGLSLSEEEMDDGIVDILADKLEEALQFETDDEISGDDSMEE
jgi:hypothetical protein